LQFALASYESDEAGVKKVCTAAKSLEIVHAHLDINKQKGGSRPFFIAIDTEESGSYLYVSFRGTKDVKSAIADISYFPIQIPELVNSPNLSHPSSEFSPPE
jgi:hypothetical protein